MTRIGSVEKAGESEVQGYFWPKVDLQSVADEEWDAQATGRCRRDYTLFQFNTKQLHDFISLNHLLIQIDEQLDFPRVINRPTATGYRSMLRVIRVAASISQMAEEALSPGNSLDTP